MFRRLLTLFRYQPSDDAEARLGEALRVETQEEWKRDLASPDYEEAVQDVMRAIAASPGEALSPRSPRAFPAQPSISYLLPAAALIILFLFALKLSDGPEYLSNPEQAAPANPTTSARFSDEIEGVLAFLDKPFFSTTPDLVTFARALPIVRETEHIKADVKKQADTLLLMVRRWAKITRPTLPQFTFPELSAPPETPYGNELENLRLDADRVFRSLGRSIPAFPLEG